MGRKRKPKTREELFFELLRRWEENEIQCIQEWCIRNRLDAIDDVKKEAADYRRRWEDMKERGV